MLQYLYPNNFPQKEARQNIYEWKKLLLSLGWGNWVHNFVAVKKEALWKAALQERLFNAHGVFSIRTFAI